jgi:CheY-like chemotaxis protein
MNNPPRVLIVDDELQISDLFGRKLTLSGFEVISAMNGQVGYEMAKKEKPDLILLDLKMPVMDGAEAFAKLKSDPETKDIKVMFLSSYNDRSAMKIDAEFAKNLGAMDFIPKTDDVDAVVVRVKSALGLNK